MEIEFKTDSGQATGQKLYLQLKSGNAYLRKQSKSLEAIFTIKKKRHAKYWMNQAFPVLLIIRNAEGEVRWMEIRDWLKTATNNGQNHVSQIPFKGERFDVMSVRRWRERQLLPLLQRFSFEQPDFLVHQFQQPRFPPPHCLVSTIVPCLVGYALGVRGALSSALPPPLLRRSQTEKIILTPTPSTTYNTFPQPPKFVFTLAHATF